MQDVVGEEKIILPVSDPAVWLIIVSLIFNLKIVIPSYI